MMYRMEIFSNQSVQDDILETLEEYIPHILYTTVPIAYGRGGESRKLGTSTWPETNFILVSYLADSDVPLAKAVIKGIKKRFPNEGIKLFFVHAEDI